LVGDAAKKMHTAQKAYEKAKEAGNVVEMVKQTENVANLIKEDKIKKGVDGNAGKGTSGNSVANELTGITQKQLDKKFKHAADFGITTTKKNAETLSQYETAIKSHMGDKATKPLGTYGFVTDSKVFFNSNTNNVVVLDKSGNFITGFKITPGTPQYENYMKNGVLR
ncbi:colicin D domain-containing protein, partial [Snodgrassella sp. CS2]|uniref:colicin D domain-containing protein n=1 Tax=Snodgrassella sp. CS2 TaxID=3418953 RepID=UPI003D00FECA